ncbi:hypothetical protein RRG08_027809 [Elysia crispata]|uniref:Uncharacterized protein n=1 Tax=Elysia crispata TaxID=231223 RepID=A0AAE1D5K7_9GAST|nr:hypothetical protein RRG08_027809 [Elysia crispata]
MSLGETQFKIVSGLFGSLIQLQLLQSSELRPGGKQKMAHRLHPAGIKTVDSEHFAFCQVLPRQHPQSNKKCTSCVDKCRRQPKYYVALPARRTSDTCPNPFGRQEEQECFQITCCCEETDEPSVEKASCIPSRSGSQCNDIIIIKPPEQCDQKRSEEASCRIPNMRRREVPAREPEPCSSSMVLEFVEDPVITIETDNVKHQDDCSKDSMEAQVGSQCFFYSMSGSADSSFLTKITRQTD